ncbi:MAG: ATP-dependent Clp protease adapter ClpS [Planctomycetes bacterium]|nr:ATP-dependent Clp protease adapter ClpS [Planctomycetota bacterium]
MAATRFRSSVRAATETEESTETTTVTRLGRPWNVIVHDDPITPMPYVTRVFVQVFGYPEGKAESLMLRVHHTGRAVVWTGARESAEVYVQKLQSHHLLATLEQSDA